MSALLFIICRVARGIDSVLGPWVATRATLKNRLVFSCRFGPLIIVLITIACAALFVRGKTSAIRLETALVLELGSWVITGDFM